MPNYRLTRAAEADLEDIWRYSYDTWGLAQADHYLNMLIACLARIGDGTAVQQRYPDLPTEIIAHRCGQHIIFWLERDGPRIVAILNPRMDLSQQLRPRL